MRRIERPERVEQPLYWYCGKCDSRIADEDGQIFERVSMSLGRALMLFQQSTHLATYEDAALDFVFKAEDSPAAKTTIAEWYGLARDARRLSVTRRVCFFVSWRMANCLTPPECNVDILVPRRSEMDRLRNCSRPRFR